MKKNPNIERWIRRNTNKRNCKCGCGEYVVPNYWRYFRNRTMSFIANHQNRGKYHPNYGDGQIVAKGYVWVLLHGHPRTTPRGYVKRCWLAIEKKIGRYLRDGEIVHHRNGNKLDDSPENLEITDRVQHGKIHNTGPRHTNWRGDIDAERDIIPLRNSGMTIKTIAKHLHCSDVTIVRRLRTWRNRHTLPDRNMV